MSDIDEGLMACAEADHMMALELTNMVAELEDRIEQLENGLAQAHMAGQADAGVDPSWSNAQEYVARIGTERIEQLEAGAAKVCVWEYQADYDLPYWSTSCGDAVCFGEGRPDELTRGNVNFCWMCGGKVAATTEGEGNG
jgi:hypothetical protein